MSREMVLITGNGFLCHLLMLLQEIIFVTAIGNGGREPIISIFEVFLQLYSSIRISFHLFTRRAQTKKSTSKFNWSYFSFTKLTWRNSIGSKITSTQILGYAFFMSKLPMMIVLVTTSSSHPPTGAPTLLLESMVFSADFFLQCQVLWSIILPSQL